VARIDASRQTCVGKLAFTDGLVGLDFPLAFLILGLELVQV